MHRSVNLQWLNVGSLPFTKTEISSQIKNLYFNKFLNTLAVEVADPQCNCPQHVCLRSQEYSTWDNLIPQLLKNLKVLIRFSYLPFLLVVKYLESVMVFGALMWTYSKRKEFLYSSYSCTASSQLILITFIYKNFSIQNWVTSSFPLSLVSQGLQR